MLEHTIATRNSSILFWSEMHTKVLEKNRKQRQSLTTAVEKGCKGCGIIQESLQILDIQRSHSHSHGSRLPSFYVLCGQFDELNCYDQSTPQVDESRSTF